MNPDCGIYAITSPSGKQYIGQAISFKKRWWEHLSDLRNGSHHCKGLQSAYIKYGEASLVFSIIAIVAPGDLNAREQKELDARGKSALYNTALNVVRPRLGLKHTIESRAKMSLANQNRSDEYRRKLSAGRLGKVHDATSRAAMSLALSGDRNPNWGKKLSSERIENLRKAQQNRSPEWRERIAAAKRGKKRSAETVAKMSTSMVGKSLGGKSATARPVFCYELGEAFPSISDAVRWLRINDYPNADVSAIIAACKGKIKFAYRLHWKYDDI